MKFMSTKENLTYGFQAVQRAIVPNSPLPILTGIKLSTGDGCIVLVATDLELGIRCIIPAEIIEHGGMVLPARYISELIRKLPDVPIFFESDQYTTGVKIKYGQSETIINGFPPEEFPGVDFDHDSFDFYLNEEVFKEAIRQVSFASAHEDTRPIFTGVLMEIRENGMVMVATDTHRLAWRTLSIDEATCGDINLIIPGKTLNELARVIGSPESKIRVTLTGNQALFNMRNLSFISRLIDGNFPNYRQVIPTGFVSRLSLKTRDLLEATERASLLAKDGTPVIRLYIEKNLLVIKVSTEAGRVYEEVGIQHDGELLQVAFNARYLSEALKVVGTEDIDLEFTGPLSPAIIRPSGESNYFSLLLPVRLNEG
ncbi:MAG: DNA polymerase III subunit beta [Eubacteriales bacterium]